VLYLHGGLPRTGTSSLQSALFECRGQLADAGMVYPDNWPGNGGIAHHELYELVVSWLGPEGEIDTTKRFLAEHSDRAVLLSTESLATHLQYEGRLEPLLEFLAAVQEVMPVRCVWCLRRFDRMVSSLHLLGLWHGVGPPSRSEVLAHACRLDYLFAGFRAVEEAIGGNVVYVRYDSNGTHNDELLRAFNIPADVATTIRQALEEEPRQNASPSRKTAIALTNRGVLETAGIRIDEATLKAMRHGQFEFQEDGSCELLEFDVRRDLHEQALTAARKHGVTAYTDFFEDTEVDASVANALEPDALTAEDLRRLAAHR
jgi:hypothetical protein